MRKNNYPVKKSVFMVCLMLCGAILIPYWQVKNHSFTNYDDNLYITENPIVQKGLTPQGIAWAFTTGHTANWHPLTWISHMIDCGVFGNNPGAHHLVNVVFHIANTLLLFLILLAMTGGMWKSAFVAALFALHPMHVESVAWAAERKDVLSAFFWMLTMLAYFRYVKLGGTGRYTLVVLCFVLGLLSKPMVVSLPLVLFLLDFWPLNRIGLGQTSESIPRVSLRKAIIEKLPLLALTLASCVVTMIVQARGGAMGALTEYTPHIRISNAVLSYGNYIWKMVFPTGLAVLYPFPKVIILLKVAGVFLLLALVTILAIKASRRRPYLLTGWLWYGITLFPVIGIVQVGIQAMANRYSYLPFIGLFIVLVWGISELWQKANKTLFVLGCSAVLAVLTAVTYRQVGFWKDSISLFEHDLAVTVNNQVAFNNYGTALVNKGQTERAKKCFILAIRIDSSYGAAYNNLANTLLESGRKDEAISNYRKAIVKDPANELIRLNFEKTLIGTQEEAVVRYNLGNALMEKGRPDDAIGHYKEALRINPYFVKAYDNFGIALASKGRLDEAIATFNKALAINPYDADVHNNVGNALADLGRLDEAIGHCKEALEIKPGFSEAHNNLGTALAKKGKYDEAIKHFEEAVRIQPDFGRARMNLERARQILHS
jgi:protein O-mannosyl-transferase